MAFPRQNHTTLYDTDTAAQSVATLADLTATDRRWRLRRILASYGTSTQAGTVTVTVGGQPVLVYDFVGNVGDALDFGDAGWQLPQGAVVVTLSAGAAGVVSHLTTIAFPE